MVSAQATTSQTATFIPSTSSLSPPTIVHVTVPRDTNSNKVGLSLTVDNSKIEMVSNCAFALLNL